MRIKHKVILFWRLRFKQKALFLVNFFLCGLARAAIVSLPLRRISPFFGRFYKTTTVSTLILPHQIRQAAILGRSIRLAARYTPWDSSCLTQAMVAKFWCSVFKIPYMFFIGFAKSPEEPSGYKAHAWVTAGPVAVTGGQGLLDYHVVSSYIGVVSDASIPCFSAKHSQ